MAYQVEWTGLHNLEGPAAGRRTGEATPGRPALARERPTDVPRPAIKQTAVYTARVTSAEMTL